MTINPTPPNLSDLDWRPVTGDYLTALVDLVGTCYLSDGGLHFLFEPDEIIGRCFPDASGVTIGAFTPDEQLAACCSVYIGNVIDTQLAMIVGQVRPDQRGRGIGTFLMRWSQVQAQSLLANIATDQQVLQIRTESLTGSAAHLYLTHGFEPVHEELIMRRDLHLPLPDRPLPSDVTIASWQPDLAAQFFAAYDASFRERPGFPGWTRAEWVDSWMNDNFRPEWSLLARLGDTPLGFLTSAANPPHGFIVQAGVVPTQRRRGLGSGIMVETMRRMQADGAISIQLTVNVNNSGAIKTYNRLGFVTIGRRARCEQRTRCRTWKYGHKMV